MRSRDWAPADPQKIRSQRRLRPSIVLTMWVLEGFAEVVCLSATPTSETGSCILTTYSTPLSPILRWF